ncbi:MAG: hypothetical protein A3I26_02100 [Candidatus Yanofskybacteria bacterium RIFCSPLOWO2_02_FULL_43_10]|uniref:HTH psq-type domain-containing protein n=1 Tax=Candidatus Yanofskybacteria bacterium RIFCSPLOWO2_12_FULL_43_11b TaxID=1802710 RepID=A0A1F8H8K2_9BACT|nr:MAG: hypothetical protein A2742_02445 [Candidatus Yanofskybacteria bacterium RIFCSPHIGHO2_01_FULL_43_32]OGN11551.1 MAG: hypothetical protein A3C69_03785 [Candidatus Yanofskybacteria bacterium RIFCSPHIGHO2_02_FULL_43_12]OGN17436.1 MAG: hypothetical protein A3E34_01735 [Candidatus Yanofskybacteria bacterium RIFCSPHIGHO2_12_FULL_43_11]OGN24888.1 MAG: hypothetical protein A2923_01265 [Candidatus Yanofskybacteria bacterium RIFCSPLOWO2_01_FULL_43_46]OGN30262.1 MAG: hypothetical protein A3I26_02100
MVHIKNNNPKDFAIELRKGGYSYSEIKKFCPVPKSTLSYWFRDIKLSEPQLTRLKKKRIEAAQKGSKARILKTSKAIEEIQKTSAKDVGKISKRELWLMGVILYWRERLLNKNDSDLKKGIRFTSSDPYLIKLFLKWLSDIGGIKNEEINFDIFMPEDKKRSLNEFVDYWAGVTGFTKGNFSRYYLQKVKAKKPKRNSKKSVHGLLRVRVKASSMLARQISGWINGINEILLG